MIQELIFIILFEFPKIEKIFMMAQNGYIECNEKKLSKKDSVNRKMSIPYY